MQERILINGEYLDLYPNEKVNLNLQVNKLSDVSSRNSSFSNSFKIPRTAKNERLLEHAGTIGNRTTVPYNIVRCAYQRDTTTIVNNGFIKLTDTFPDSYQVVIFDGILDFQEQLNGLNLQDLDYGDLTFELNIPTYRSTYLNSGSADGIVYAVGVFQDGEPLLPTQMPIEEQLPSIKAKTIWDKIFSTQGYSYTGEFFNTNTDWQELVVAPSIGMEITSSVLTVTSIGTALSNTQQEDSIYGTFTTYTTSSNFTSSAFTADLTVGTKGNLNVNFTGTLNLQFTSSFTINDETTGWLEVKQNGVTKATRNIFGTSPEEFETTLEVTTGDFIRLDIRVQTDINYLNPTQSQFIMDYSVQSRVNAAKYEGGTLINPSRTVGDLEQLAFIKDMLQRFGLIMLKSRQNDNEYRFVTFEELLNDRANAQDWTDKLIRIDSETYESGYAQINRADYKYPQDVVPYMEGELVIDNQTSILRSELFNSPFEIPNSVVGTRNGQPLYSIPTWVLEDGNYVPSETPIKLMRVKYNSTDHQVTLFGSAATLVTEDVPYLSIEDMSYQYFFDTYYPSFKKLLDRYKEVNATVYLNDIDIQGLDFFRLVYLKQTGQYYYLDSVKSSGGGIAKIKLIEINYE